MKYRVTKQEGRPQGAPRKAERAKQTDREKQGKAFEYRWWGEGADNNSARAATQRMKCGGA
jgi:hypothetical protein